MKEFGNTDRKEKIKVFINILMEMSLLELITGLKMFRKKNKDRICLLSTGLVRIDFNYGINSRNRRKMDIFLNLKL